MELQIGDLVVCPPSGGYRGQRIGKIKKMTKRVNGTFGAPVLVGYIDYPEEMCGWATGIGAWVHPIRKIKFENESDWKIRTEKDLAESRNPAYKLIVP